MAVVEPDIGHGPAVQVLALDRKGDVLPEYLAGKCLLCRVAEGLLQFQGIDAVQPHPDLQVGGSQDRNGVAVMDSYDPARNGLGDRFGPESGGDHQFADKEYPSFHDQLIPLLLILMRVGSCTRAPLLSCSVAP